MVLNVNNRILYKTRKKFILTPFETKAVMLLANNKLNTYEEIKRFAYKTNVSNSVIRTRMKELEKRIKIQIQINNYGIKTNEKIAILKGE